VHTLTIILVQTGKMQEVRVGDKGGYCVTDQKPCTITHLFTLHN